MNHLKPPLMNARNKKRLKIGCIVVGLLAATIVLYSLINRGPSYQGQDVSYWFSQYCQSRAC